MSAIKVPSVSGAMRLILILLVTVLTGCGSGAIEDPDGSTGDPVGELIVYATTVPETQAALAEAFTEKTGIPVRSLRLSTGPLAQRFMEEKEAGQHVADVVTLGDRAFYEDLVAQGFLRSLADIEGYEDVPADWRPSEYYFMQSQGAYTILYNTDLLTGDDIPKNWDDLLDPRFKGQIVAADPRNNPAVLGSLYLAIEAEFGEEYFRKLAEQDVTYVSNSPAAVSEVVAGEASIAFPSLAMSLLGYEGTGAPIAALAAPPSPTSMIHFYTGVVAGGPNEEAAVQWVEFLLSEEGQQIANDRTGSSFLGEGVEGSHPMPARPLNFGPDESVEELPRFLKLLGLE